MTFCEAHHVEHWADGGATRLDNLVQLCRRHHRAVHEEGFTVELLPGGEARFRRPDGRPLPQAPPLPAAQDDPVAVFEELVAAEGILLDPAAFPAMPSGGEGRGVDYGGVVAWLWALKAT